MASDKCDGTNSSIVGRVFGEGRELGGGIGSYVGSKISGGNGTVAKIGQDVGGFFGGGGAIGYSYCKWGAKLIGDSCSSPPSKSISVLTNTIVSNAVYSAVLQCQDSSVTTQKMSANCSGGSNFGNNRGCTLCEDVRSTLLKKRYALQVDSLNRSGLTVEPESFKPNAMVSALWEGDFQPCEYVCDACGIGDVSQKSTIRVTSKCVSDDGFVQSVRDQIKTASSQAVQNISDVSGDIARLFASDQDCMISDLSARIENNITDSEISEVATSCVQNQQINITGNSLWANRLNEGITAQTMVTFAGSLDITDRMYTSSELSSSQELIQKNANIQELSDDLNSVIVSATSMFQSTTGRTLILVAGLAITAVLVLVMFAVSDPDGARGAIGSFI